MKGFPYRSIRSRFELFDSWSVFARFEYFVSRAEPAFEIGRSDSVVGWFECDKKTDEHLSEERGVGRETGMKGSQWRDKAQQG